MAIGSRSKILTIMMTDIVDYTKLSSLLGREKFDRLNENFDRLSLPLFEKYGGQVIKKVGDSFIVSFESATDSLHCAIEMQNRFWEYNEHNPELPIMIKIALNAGEVLIRDRDIYGEAVNVLSRVEKLTLPGEIFFTHPVFLAMNKNEIPYIYLGRKNVKGISHPIEIFKVKKTEKKSYKINYRWLGEVAFNLLMLLFWIAVMVFVGWVIYKIVIVSGLWEIIKQNLS